MLAKTYFSCCVLLAISLNIKPVYSVPKCPVHEFYNTAASKCTPEPTCQNTSPHAVHSCVEDNCEQRCECIEGYIRDETKHGRCVKLSECPCLDCGENEVLNTCASSCDIEPTCDNPNPEVDSCCVPETIQRCECAPGYIREHQNGRCICNTSCPCCGENEVLNTCASSCDVEPTCDNQNPEADPCCVPETIQRCECAPGYVRDPNGNCICVDSCPCCDALTEVICCKPCCEVTCQHPDGCNCRTPCDEHVCELGCVCKEHYTRDEHTNKCVAVCFPDLVHTLHHGHGHGHGHHGLHLI